MPHFTVLYFDPTRSSVVEERAQADSEASLRKHWADIGRVVLTLRRDGDRPGVTATRDTAFDVAWWCRELGTLLKAGMTVVEALDTLHAQSRGGLREQVHARLLRSLREGQSMSRAMQAAAVFPEVLVASVTASERTSTLTS